MMALFKKINDCHCNPLIAWRGFYICANIVFIIWLVSIVNYIFNLYKDIDPLYSSLYILAIQLVFFASLLFFQERIVYKSK